MIRASCCGRIPISSGSSAIRAVKRLLGRRRPRAARVPREQRLRFNQSLETRRDKGRGKRRPLRQAYTTSTGGFSPMRSIAFADFLIGLGILFVLEGVMFAASPAWMRRAMKSAMATPDNILRAVGIGSAVLGLILIWLVRR